LLGATGVMWIDGMTIELVPIGGAATTNLVRNGDFELGDPDPDGWLVMPGAHRAARGFRSPSALELTRAGARALSGLAVPIEAYRALELSVAVRAEGLRGAGGASAVLFFLDDDGRVVPGLQAPVFTWSGTFDWRPDRAVVPIPAGAIRA